MRTTVPRAELSNLRMAAGNENKYPVVIVDGVLKEWVGIGWIDIDTATEQDYDRVPEAV